MSGSGLFVHVGDPTHGVSRYGRVLAAAAPTTPAIDLHGRAEPNWIDDLVAEHRRLRPGWVAFQFTDQLWGCAPAEAATRFEQVVAMIWPSTAAVVVHDVPDPRADPPERVEAYQRVVRAAGVTVVASHHEACRLVAAGADTEIDVVPHFVEHRRVPLTARRPAVGVLGFVYPGKGHDAVLDALAELDAPRRLDALGTHAPLHAELVLELRAQAKRLGVMLGVTGWIDEAALSRALASVAVPVVPNANISASGSLATWVGAGRRPLVRRGPYVEEFEALAPDMVEVYDGDDPSSLPRAIHEAWSAPHRTWNTSVPEGLSPTAIVERQVAIFTERAA